MKKIVTISLLITLIIGIPILSENNPKIGLVLSGGGMKGFGHLGTLHILDSLNIPIDYVVGTSIGAISAALYATGHSVYEIDKIASETNWGEIFGQTRRRDQLYYFKKDDDGKFQLSFYLRGFTPTSPISLSSGQYSYEYLLDLFKNYPNVQNYDNLIIPFRCNATDIMSGNEIIFSNGSLAKALRASSSIPTIFSPIEQEEKLLVDGGLVNNLPINLAEKLGAEYIIASNVMSSYKSKDEIIDVFNIIGRIIDLYGYQNEQDNILKADILINPELKNTSLINFNLDKIEETKIEGKKAAYKHIEKFLELAKQKSNTPFIKLAAITKNIIQLDSIILSEDMKGNILISKLFIPEKEISKEEITNNMLKIRNQNKYHNIYYKFAKNTENESYDFYLYGIKNNPIYIVDIEINGNKKINSDEIKKMFTIGENQILNIKTLNNEIQNTYKMGYFEYINYDIVNINNDSSKLVINIKESENKKIKLGANWDNYYKLIGKIKLDVFNKPFKKFRLQDELLFSGIKKNKLTLYYLLINNNKIKAIPFIKQINL